jgi:hypothetical protein
MEVEHGDGSGVLAGELTVTQAHAFAAGLTRSRQD